MCAIIGWAGKLPVGFLSAMLREAEARGRDSTGIAYREAGQSVSYRQAVNGARFAKDHDKILGAARRSDYGIAHTRRASPGMPVNDENAHPFNYGGFLFAHNGRVENWQALRTSLRTRYLAEGNQRRAEYFEKAGTDSMVLGDFIEARNFEPVEGSLGLVWMRSGKVFAMHSAKELCAAHITWWIERPRTPEEEGRRTMTIVASTAKMILQALFNTRGAKRADHSHATVLYDYQDIVTLDEATVYRIEAPEYTDIMTPRIENLKPGTGVVSEGPCPVNPANHVDVFTSQEDTPTGTVVAAEAPKA